MKFLIDAEIVLSELSGALRVSPREIAEAAVRRMALREASAFLHATVGWVHPCDLALRMTRTSMPVSKAVAGATIIDALPVTYSGRIDYPRQESVSWANEMDRHIDFATNVVGLLGDIFIAGLHKTPNRRLKDLFSGLSHEFSGISIEDWLHHFDGTSLTHSRKDGGRSSLLDVFRKIRGQSQHVLYVHNGIHAENSAQTENSFQRTLLNVMSFPIARGKMQRSLFLLPWMAKSNHVNVILENTTNMPDQKELDNDGSKSEQEIHCKEIESMWLKSVRDSAMEGMAIVFALMEVSRKWRQLPRKTGTFSENVMAHVFKTSVATVGSVSSNCGISRQSALNTIKSLESKGILMEMTGRETYRVWSCVP